MHSDPLRGEVWRRGAILGLQWVAVFFAMTILVYGVIGITGWSGVMRALCAMAVGPVLAASGIAAWWVLRRPSLAPEETSGIAEGETMRGGEKSEDGDGTRDSRDSCGD
jgi:hypothetical protein